MNKKIISFLKPALVASKYFRILYIKRLVPIFLVLLILVLISFFGDNFLTEYEVEVTQAIAYPQAKEAPIDDDMSIRQKGQLLFQASGWIEPDPFPIYVTSLYSGVVEKVHILEGQSIKQGEIIATLIDEDARLVLSEYNAMCSQSISEEAIIEAEIELAKAGLNAAHSKVSETLILLQENNDTVERFSSLSQGVVAEQVLYRAKLALKRQKAEFETARSNVKQQEALVRKLEETLITQKKKTEVLSVQRHKAELDLNRTKIKSPIDGIILRLLAKPGSRMMLHMDDMDAAAAAVMFEEGKLQARIDVPLNEVAKINMGQMVEISSSILPEQVFMGKISRILGEADIQRNTLQVKVSLLDPDPKLRPEMLCRAKFFEMSNNTKESISELKVFLDKNHLSSEYASASSEKELWVISKDGKTSEKRKVSFGNTFLARYLEVTKGLLAGEKIILNPPQSLENGDRVKISKIK